jgi:hypothetical protein
VLIVIKTYLNLLVFFARCFTVAPSVGTPDSKV